MMGTTVTIIEILLNAFCMAFNGENSEKWAMSLYDMYFSVSNWSTNLDQSVQVGDPGGHCDHISLPKPSYNMNNIVFHFWHPYYITTSKMVSQ